MLFIYTDGSVVRPKDGSSPGGWAFYYEREGIVYQGSGGVLGATNNQMEIVAAIKAFQSLLENNFTDDVVVIVSDSQYVINGGSQWVLDWKRNRWRNGRGKLIKNRKQWKQLDILASHFMTKWKWVRGHNGHPFNEVCDKAARRAAFRADGLIKAAS